jgi:dienelactone hydrolase
VHGSGPNDQDETVLANKPFRDVAWGLASRGVAVLRYVKRTKAYPDRPTSGGALTLKEETVDDALAAVALLKKTEGIDAKRIFVLGHSLGGTAIPRIGAADATIRGFIVLAGTTRPLEDVILEQMTYILSNQPTMPQAKKDEAINSMKVKVALVKDAKLSATTSARDLPFAVPAEYWLDLRGYKPAEAARQLKQPMLILQGERDYQVTMDDFNGWKTALGDRKNVVFKTYPKLNHLFMAGEGKILPTEYMRPGRVAASVIEDIAAWVKAQ